MQFLTPIIALLSTTALSVAVPAPASEISERQIYTACTGLYGTAQCCATDILGLADLDCGDPSTIPESPDNFSAICAAIGQRARCCVLPILDQGILCNTPIGVVDP